MISADWDRLILSAMKYSFEFAKVARDYQYCVECIINYNRCAAWVCLQEMIRTYGVEIELFARLIGDSTRIIYGRPLEMASDKDIQNELSYIASLMKFYFLLRVGEDELVKRFFEWWKRSFIK